LAGALARSAGVLQVGRRPALLSSALEGRPAATGDETTMVAEDDRPAASIDATTTLPRWGTVDVSEAPARRRPGSREKERRVLEAVIFDMDGLLVDSEPMWFRVRKALAHRHGKIWSEEDQRAMAGVHTDVWVAALHDKLEGALSPDEIFDEVTARMASYYERGGVPILAGAPEALAACAGRYRVGLASGSPQHLIEACLHGARWEDHFEARISSDELERGKPAPDVYLGIMRRMDLDPAATAVVEDSGAGIEAGKAAGAKVIAVPNPHTDPGPEILGLADACVGSLHELPAALEKF
jgi:HAD superfamily hydrolase (TIGR01509 family)